MKMNIGTVGIFAQVVIFVAGLHHSSPFFSVFFQVAPVRVQPDFLNIPLFHNTRRRRRRSTGGKLQYRAALAPHRTIHTRAVRKKIDSESLGKHRVHAAAAAAAAAASSSVSCGCGVGRDVSTLT